MILNRMKLTYFKAGEDITQDVFRARMSFENNSKGNNQPIPSYSEVIYVVPEGVKGDISISRDKYGEKIISIGGYTIEQLMNDPEQLAKLHEQIIIKYENVLGVKIAIRPECARYCLVETRASGYLVCKRHVEDIKLNTQMKEYIENNIWGNIYGNHQDGGYKVVDLSYDKVFTDMSLEQCERHIRDRMMPSKPFDYYSNRIPRYWSKYIVVNSDGTAELHYLKTRKYKTTKQTFKEGEVAVYDLHKIAFCEWKSV